MKGTPSISLKTYESSIFEFMSLISSESRFVILQNKGGPNIFEKSEHCTIDDFVFQNAYGSDEDFSSIAHAQAVEMPSSLNWNVSKTIEDLMTYHM